MDILRKGVGIGGRIFNTNTVNVGTIDTSQTFGTTLVDRNDPVLEAVVHVFSLGLINGTNSALYGRAGLPVFVTAYPTSVPDHVKIVHYSGVVDLWIPTYVKDDGHVYFDLEDVAFYNESINPVQNSVQDAHAIVSIEAFVENGETILKIPSHDFQIGDDVTIIVSENHHKELQEIALESREVTSITENRIHIKYPFPNIDLKIDLENPPLAKYEFYTESDSTTSASKVDTSPPPMEYMGLTGRLQPSYQAHESNSIYLIASILHGLTMCYMHPENLELFVPGDKLYMHMMDSPNDTLSKRVWYSPNEEETVCTGHGCIQSIRIGTFIGHVQTPTGEYASIDVSISNTPPFNL